jgi:hypothetical protein
LFDKVGGTFVRLRHPENLRKLDSAVTILQIGKEVEQLTKLPNFPKTATRGSFGKFSAIIGNGLATLFLSKYARKWWAGNKKT